MNMLGRRLSMTTSSGAGLKGSMIFQPVLPFRRRGLSLLG